MTTRNVNRPSFSPVRRRQRRLLRDAGGFRDERTDVKKPKPEDRNRLYRSKRYQEDLKVLKPPVRVDESKAKDAASPGRYPIFDEGDIARYEDTVAEVVQSIEKDIAQIRQEEGESSKVAAELEKELAVFNKLSREAWQAAKVSDVNAQQAAELAGIGKAELRRERRERPASTNGGNGSDTPSTPAPEPDRPSMAGRPASVRAELEAIEAEGKASAAEAKAMEARRQAVMSAKKVEQMRQSLQRMRGLVRDSKLTAAGLPEDKDDKANARVETGEEIYADAYARLRSFSQHQRGAPVRLDRTLWLTERVGKLKADATSTRQQIEERNKSRRLPRPSAEERRKFLRMGRTASIASIERQYKEIKPTPLKAASETAKFFRDATPAKPKRDTGEPLTARYSRIPAPPPYKEPPEDRGLRSYQRDLKNDIKEAGDTNLLVVSPTGSGKTVIAASYIKDEIDAGRKVAFLAHTDELIGQSQSTIEEVTGRKAGLVQGQSKDFGKRVTIISHGTVSDNPGSKIPKNFRPDVLVIDEAHHSAAEGYQDVIENLKPKKLVGFTATPYRPSGAPGDLADTYAEIACRVDTQDLINEGRLVPPTVVDANLRNAAGAETNINRASNAASLYAEAAANARRNGRKKIIIFAGANPQQTPSDAVRDTTAELVNQGFNASDILGTTNDAERKQAIRDFRRRERGVLVNYGALNEGFDVPSTDSIVLGRNVGSKGTLAQIVGRGMRPDRRNRKQDVLVVNMSEMSAADIQQQVLTQVQPPAKRGRIPCGDGLSPYRIIKNPRGMPNRTPEREVRRSRRASTPPREREQGSRASANPPTLRAVVRDR